MVVPAATYSFPSLRVEEPRASAHRQSIFSFTLYLGTKSRPVIPHVRLNEVHQLQVLEDILFLV